MPEYKNIKARPQTFERLRDAKPEGVTWDRWLTMLADDYGVPEVDGDE